MVQLNKPENLVLNLGSGTNHKKNCINVDKSGSPDLLYNLEQTPWPWETNSTRRVFLEFILEQLGPANEDFFNIIRELYRILKPGGLIRLKSAHPRHHSFINNFCNLRPIMPETFIQLNQILDVNFEIERSVHMLAEPWYTQLKLGEISDKQLQEACQYYNNVIETIVIDLKVIK